MPWASTRQNSCRPPAGLTSSASRSKAGAEPDEGYVHAFGLVGSALGVVPFHHYWLRGLKLGISKPLGHYVLHTLAIAANRFGHLNPPPNSPLPPLPYAFHFDASLYAKFLRGFAEQRGIVRQEGRIVSVRTKRRDRRH